MRLQVERETPILVAGGGGFIGGWLVKTLIDEGFIDVRVVDIKPINEWFQVYGSADNFVADLSRLEECERATSDRAVVFNMAADMGGMGFIENNKALCMLSVLINTHLLQASRSAGVGKFFFASSACVYNEEKQSSADVKPLRESDAYPAMPEDGYGWEKLFSERMVRHFDEDFGLSGRVARFHNVYGPRGTWNGGREKAPAALCRKVAVAAVTGESRIEIWGDGNQTRSFTYIDDAIEGTLRLMNSDVKEPVNIGSEQLVSINQMVGILEEISGLSLERIYLLDAPRGVRGRNSDNEFVREQLDWAPSVELFDGLAKTYDWVSAQVRSLNH